MWGAREGCRRGKVVDDGNVFAVGGKCGCRDTAEHSLPPRDAWWLLSLVSSSVRNHHQHQRWAHPFLSNIRRLHPETSLKESKINLLALILFHWWHGVGEAECLVGDKLCSTCSISERELIIHFILTLSS